MLTFQQIFFVTKPSEFEISDICDFPLYLQDTSVSITPCEGGWSRLLWATSVLALV